MFVRERAVDCPLCSGTGIAETCARCSGRGRLRSTIDEDRWNVCGYCKGTGNASCARCHRTGRVRFYWFLCPACGFVGPESEGHLEDAWADLCPHCGAF